MWEIVEGLAKENCLKFFESINAEHASSMRALIEQLKEEATSTVSNMKAPAAARSQNGTTDGKRAYQPILTAAVYDG